MEAYGLTAQKTLRNGKVQTISFKTTADAVAFILKNKLTEKASSARSSIYKVCADSCPNKTAYGYAWSYINKPAAPKVSATKAKAAKPAAKKQAKPVAKKPAVKAPAKKQKKVTKSKARKA